MRIIDRKRADFVFALLFVVLTAAQVAAVIFSPLDLAPDESHYWEWSRRLDWSYYSKGPLVAYLIAGSRALFGDTVFAVRFPAIVCFAIFSLSFYLFARRILPPLQALVGWIAIRLSLAFAQMGVVMTTDAPAALFWLLAIICMYRAVVDERHGYWIWFGLCVGVGMLAKYTLFILYPSVLLLVFLAGNTRHLSRWQFWLGVSLCALCLLPVLVWNQAHQWVNFSHNAGHLVKESGLSIRPEFFFELLAGQLGLVGPLVFGLIVYGFVVGYRAARSGDLVASVFVSTILPLALLILAVSFTKRVYANWPIPLSIGGILLFCHLHAHRAISPTARALVRPAIFLNLFLTVIAHFPFLGVTFGVPGKILTTKKLVGWSALGELVDVKLEKGFPGGRSDAFILADDYEVASQIAFFSKAHPEVYCDYLDDRRMNQYDIWGGWEKLQGRDALIVLRDPARIEKLRPRFQTVEPFEIQPNLRVSYSGTDLRAFYLFRGRGYDGSVPPLPARR